jgi:hypothetical protein
MRRQKRISPLHELHAGEALPEIWNENCHVGNDWCGLSILNTPMRAKAIV